MDAVSISFDPLVPMPLFWALAVALALVGGLGLVLWARGAVLRLAIMAVAVLLLARPTVIEEQRQPVPDTALVVIDRSPSQDMLDRADRTDLALDALMARLDRFDDLAVRVIETDPAAAGGLERTDLFDRLRRATADLPRDRLAGTIILTDGQIHDAPEDPADLAEFGPVHGLITGSRREADRRLTIADAPAFGVVGEPLEVTLRVDDLGFDGASGGLALITAEVDGGEDIRFQVPIGQETTIDILMEHGGDNVIEFEVETRPGELSEANNRAVVVATGVRDRLRVLLVSGEPHAGERTWRNILKSDPSVELVHFTILRPPEKQDGTPVSELSLIAFPIRELFERRLHEFDLVIFDRYRRRGVLPNIYLNNIVDYIDQGGALLEASGETFADLASLYRTPLGRILPAEPTGLVLEQPFKPRVTDLGERHPVTSALSGAASGTAAPGAARTGTADAAEPPWGRWFRHIDVRQKTGHVVMSGADDRPLLILDRIGEGRVAQLASDHIWLWSRGYEGGGPQAELLRRLAHWLMQEPELEEEDLTVAVTGTQIRVERKTLDEGPAAITATSPAGEQLVVETRETAPGRHVGRLDVDQPGIFRLTDGTHTALAVVGDVNPPELADLRATEAVLGPIAEATGGQMLWLEDFGRTDPGPAVRRVREDRPKGGAQWLGLVDTESFTITGVRTAPLVPVWLALTLLLGGLAALWWREGR